MLSEQDKQQLQKQDISEEALMGQLDRFKKGFPYLKLSAAATVEKGIMSLSVEDKNRYKNSWDLYTKGKHKITKFVPASGAASRMFKDLYSFLDASYDVPTNEFEKEFFEQIEKFAFYNELNATCVKNSKKNIKELVKEGSYKSIVENLLQEKGLNYGALPKGLLEFHNYKDSVRTPVEEHLVEGALYATSASKVVNIHFTVSSEHRELFQQLIARKCPIYEAEFGVKYNVSFSEQKTSTDTVAVDMDNNPFRENGYLLFRPGGHGALIENLNDLKTDIVFIKNIDNTIPDKIKEPETLYKKILAGVLVESQAKTFEYLKLLNSGLYTHEQLVDILYFVQNVFNVKNPEMKFLEDVELVLYLINKLNRPIRVCGMVRNLGEPGGGPFLAVSEDGTVSLQILESSQIDLSDDNSFRIFNDSSHFNPVDLVCTLVDYKGEKFDLLSFVDENTGFISEKSKDGKKLKALELPGLWNGAMSDWNTIFVEVPVETFNPVKTVNDLLRQNHL